MGAEVAETEVKAEVNQDFKKEIADRFASQKAWFQRKGRLSTAKERIAKLREMRNWVFENKAAIREAAHKDFRKPSAEVDLSEIYPVITEINHAITHLRDWMRPRKVEAPLSMLGTRSQIIYEPKGVTLIISPWNFPFMLAVGPLVSAIAAGCTVMMKPSELSAHTSDLLKKMCEDLFEKDQVDVFLGDKDVSTALLEHPFDHIFFTGSTQVGSIIMKAASKHLTSVTLELGGKSPVVVDETAKLKDAGEKLIWGKLMNSGQACVAPDYVLVQKSQEKALIEALKGAKDKLYFLDPEKMKNNPDLARIISDRHFQRLKGLIEDAVERGAEIVIGGQTDASQRYIAPTILRNVHPDSAIMQEEIFGPIMPILTYDSLDDALGVINNKSKPLAMYIFSKKQQNIDYLIRRTSAGATAINENVIHFMHPDLPFGGANHSGHGNSHGFYGFEAFSNMRPILQNSTIYTATKPVYPPFSSLKEKLIDFIVKWL